MALLIASLLGEAQEVGIGDRRGRDAVRGNGHRMRPLLIVEDEGQVGGGAQAVAPARELHVVGFEVRIRRAGLGRDVRHGEGRAGIAQRLPDMGECFAVHVLMEQRQPVEIGLRLGEFMSGEPLDAALQDSGEVLQG